RIAIPYRDGKAVALNIESQIFAHYCQADKTDLRLRHIYSPLLKNLSLLIFQKSKVCCLEIRSQSYPNYFLITRSFIHYSGNFSGLREGGGKYTEQSCPAGKVN